MCRVGGYLRHRDDITFGVPASYGLVHRLNGREPGGVECLIVDETVIDATVIAPKPDAEVARPAPGENGTHAVRGVGAPSDRHSGVERPGIPHIVGESAALRTVFAQMGKLALSDVKVLIQGESGTGKELVAQSLHHASARRARPFVTLDSSTIPEGLIESHLFGHARGAFTGAIAAHEGVFARAHTGTLFIDEISELPLHMQAKLLRVIQTGEFTVVGRGGFRHVDVRIIAATNRDLQRAVAEGRFRSDLYHRLAVVRVNLPPLRERPEDIPLLIAYFLRRATREDPSRRVRGLTARALRALMAYPWPGNVRQLENWIVGALALEEGDVIDLEHFELEHGPGFVYEDSVRERAAATSEVTLADCERRYVLETVQRVGGHRAKAAKLLGISLRGLQLKLRRYGTVPSAAAPDSSHVRVG